MNWPSLPRGARTLTIAAFLGIVLFSLLPLLILVPQQTSQAEMRSLLLAWLAVAGLASVALALWLADRLIRPIVQLTGAANRLAAGQFDANLTPGGLGEVRNLGRSFASMSTTLKLSFSALEAERDRLDAILRHMADGLVIVDADGVVTLINPAAAQILGAEQGTVVGKRLAAIVREHEVIDLFHQCMGGERPGADYSVSVERARPRRYLRAVATRTGEGRAMQVLIVLQDLTEMRRLETVRRDFLANVSHELRTPIAAIKAMVETLEDGAIDDPPAARDFLARMEREVDDLSHLVAEFLQLSRIESGQAELRRAAVAPLALAARVVDRLHPMAERAGIALSLAIADDLPPVRADRERIEQVLVNIVHNAIKFTPPGGAVIVSAREEGQSVVFAVSDTGFGIAVENLPRLFERFFKVDRARASGGTGLGLAIAKHLVQAHGGRIWAESDGPGQGARFYFTIPLA